MTAKEIEAKLNAMPSDRLDELSVEISALDYQVFHCDDLDSSATLSNAAKHIANILRILGVGK